MKLLDSLAVAIRSLSSNKLRSSLTMLGIIIGVGAVIGLTSIGRGVQSQITSTFEEMGTNVVYIQPSNPDAPGLAGMAPGFASPSLTLNDAEAIAKIDSVVGVAPTNENYVEITYGSETVVVIMEGTTPAYQQITAYYIASGQFISDRNVARKDMVVVLGSKTAEDLFGSDDPIGEKVKIKGRKFTVIGVLEVKGGTMFGFSMDDLAVTPITTYQSRLYAQQTARGENAVQSIAIKVSSAEAIDPAIEQINTILRKRHHIATDGKDDFTVVSQQQIVVMLNQVTGILTLFLGFVAGISLLVGGIGIMNIMLVSVTERTREIGVRKAIGAKRRDILVQFLLEASMLSLVGGGIGILGGWMVAKGVSSINIEGITLDAVVSPDIVILALSVSILIGLISGIYPAMRAARLNPIDALHYG